MYLLNPLCSIFKRNGSLKNVKLKFHHYSLTSLELLSKAALLQTPEEARNVFDSVIKRTNVERC